MEESEAIARCQRGDISGLAYLIPLYELQAVRVAYLIVGDRAQAEDVVQDAFLSAYEHIHQFDPRRAFGPWFLQSVVHRALRTATRDARTQPWTGKLEAIYQQFPSGNSDPIQHILTAEVKTTLWNTVSRLPADQRAAVVLRYYLDFSEAEMAAYLACPPGTVKSRLAAARRRLRQWLPTWTHTSDEPLPPIHVAARTQPGPEKELP